MTADASPVVVDARGMRCPLPVIHLARAAAALPAGTRVRVVATDPAARYDVPAWARMRGHAVEAIDVREDERGLLLEIEVLLA